MSSPSQQQQSVKPLQNYSKDSSGATVIPASKRPDGTWRKPIRVKEGFVPQEEVPVYQSKPQRTVAFKESVPVGYDPVIKDTDSKEPSKAAIKRQRAKAKKADQAVQEAADKLAKLALSGMKP